MPSPGINAIRWLTEPLRCSSARCHTGGLTPAPTFIRAYARPYDLGYIAGMAHPSLLLLHGALGTEAQFDQLVGRLDGARPLLRLTFEGHGSNRTPGPFRIERFAAQVLGLLDRDGHSAVDCFGYSMGGYVGLELAGRAPGRIRRLMTLGTKLAWSPEAAAREALLLDPDGIRSKVPKFAAVLESRHGDRWPEVVLQTREMMEHGGRSGPFDVGFWASLGIPLRLAVGDRDQTVTVEETLAAARSSKTAELEVLPGTGHPFERVALDRLANSITEFFAPL